MLTLIEQALRAIFGALDSLLGWAVSTLYSLIVQIANVDVFGDYIWEFAGRIYTFLAIFMLFKLSISMVNYILNPDQFSDKSKGFGKLIQNVIIVIVLIITVPNIFNWAYDLQSMVLNSNVLYTIVTGRKNNSNFDLDTWRDMDDEEKVKAIKNSASNAGNQLKYEIMSTFIYYKEECTNASDCEREVSAIKNGEKNSCYAIGETEGQKVGTKFSYTAAYDCLMSGDTINNKSEKKYGFISKGFKNEYKWLISTICMIAVAYVFLTFAFDVALRSVKLGVLQLIAPIPIISRLDPNSGKSGMFSKWLKECTKTYLDLFIRLLGLFFAIEIITSMTESGRIIWRGTGTPVGFGFVKIFIILGLLMFAKQLPQFIEGITGIKMDSGGLNLGKKLGGVPGLSRAGAAGIGLAGGAAANTLAAFKNKEGFRKGLGSAIAGGASGAFRGLTSKEKNAWKAGQGAIKGAVDKRNLRDQRQATGYTLDKRIGAGINTFAGLDPMAKFENQIKQYDDIGKQAGAILKRADSEMIKYNSLALSNGFTMEEHKRQKELLTALENRDTSAMGATELANHTAQLSNLRDRVNLNNKEFQKAYVDAVSSGTIDDVQTSSMITGLENSISSTSDEFKNIQIDPNTTVGSADTTRGASVKKIKDTMENEKTRTTNSADYQRALANKKQK